MLQYCDRCKANVMLLTRSRFSTAIICTTCARMETMHPNYKKFASINAEAFHCEQCNAKTMMLARGRFNQNSLICVTCAETEKMHPNYKAFGCKEFATKETKKNKRKRREKNDY